MNVDVIKPFARVLVVPPARTEKTVLFGSAFQERVLAVPSRTTGKHSVHARLEEGGSVTMVGSSGGRDFNLNHVVVVISSANDWRPGSEQCLLVVFALMLFGAMGLAAGLAVLG